MDDCNSDSDSDFESDMKTYMNTQKMVKELRESTIPRKDSMRTRYNRKMLTLRSERQLNSSGKDDEKYRIPIQVIREIMKEEEEEEEGGEEKEKRKQAEQEIEKIVAEKDYDSIERKHRLIRLERYRQETTPFAWPFDYDEYRRKDLDAIDPFLSSKSSLQNDVAVVMKHHRGLHRMMSSITIQRGLYLVRPKDFISDEEELWNSTIYKEKSMDFSKTRTILPIKSPEKRTSIFIWTRCAQKRLIEVFLLCCLKGMSAWSPRVRALIAKSIVSVKKSCVISSFTTHPKKPYSRNASSYSSKPEMYRLGLFKMTECFKKVGHLGALSHGLYGHSSKEDASLAAYSDLIHYCTTILHDQSDKKLSAIESVLRFVCLVIFTTGINFQGVSFEQRKRLTACDKERSIIRLVSNRKDLDRVNRSLFAPLLTPDFDLLDAIFEADLNGLYNKDYDLTLASILNSDMTRFLNREYQPCIFLEKDCIVICGVLYCLWGGQSERNRKCIDPVGSRETDLIAMEVRIPRKATPSRKHIEARVTNLLNKREIYEALLT